jgi:hypothetical protein
MWCGTYGTGTKIFLHHLERTTVFSFSCSLECCCLLLPLRNARASFIIVRSFYGAHSRISIISGKFWCEAIFPCVKPARVLLLLLTTYYHYADIEQTALSFPLLQAVITRACSFCVPKSLPTNPK